LARRVATSGPDAIFSVSARMALSFRAATGTVPVVVWVPDPVGLGIATSLSRPGGNITGVAGDIAGAFYAKQLDLLRQAIPSASRVAFLVPRSAWESPVNKVFVPLREAAEQAAVSLIPSLVDSPTQEPQYRRAFALMVQDRVNAVLVVSAPENGANARLIIELAEQGRLPALYAERVFPEQGGLMSYGADYPDLARHAASAIAQILKGVDPGDIPYYQATRFELVVNLKAARVLGINLPATLLGLATDVIE
jgi:putative ABC transport system substrate-binding protein